MLVYDMANITFVVTLCHFLFDLEISSLLSLLAFSFYVISWVLGYRWICPACGTALLSLDCD